MIGNLILKECLNRDDVNRVTCIVRKPLGIKHEKLVEVIHSDFLNYSAIENELQDQEFAFTASGFIRGKCLTMSLIR